MDVMDPIQGVSSSIDSVAFMNLRIDGLVVKLRFETGKMA